MEGALKNKTIVVLDDEVDILELIEVSLRKNGFEPVTFEFVDEFWLYLEKKMPDLIVLDLMLNDADGLDICKSIRTRERFADIPIIMLTARGDEADKIVGLEIGADDYVTKPFSPRELIARIKAVLKRVEKVESRAEQIKIKEGLIIDIKKFEVRIDNRVIDMTATEFRLLTKLTENIGWVYTREQLLDFLWGDDKKVVDRTIDVHIKNLRDKLKEHGDIIKGVRGVGYKIEL
jgi:two-component system phosphate regulon response regulator PhoB/two-component system alkaline phosphatase synthesis response regulator PhoP